jgi:hypothetical protein
MESRIEQAISRIINATLSRPMPESEHPGCAGVRTQNSALSLAARLAAIVAENEAKLRIREWMRGQPRRSSRRSKRQDKNLLIREIIALREELLASRKELKAAKVDKLLRNLEKSDSLVH